MRVIALVVLVGLASCAPPGALDAGPVRLTPAEQARWDEAKAEAARQEAALPSQTPAERARMARESEILAAATAEAMAKERQAAAICNARGDMARTTYPDRSLLGLDAIFAGNQARNICWNLYQQTGITPNF